MSEQERKLALFTLGISLVELLGEEQAIADLRVKSKEVIQKVVSEPEIVMRNLRAKNTIKGEKL